MLFTTCCWILFCRYWSWWSHSIQRAWLQPGFQNESENPRKGHHCGKCSFLWQWPLQGSHNGSDCWCRNCHGCQGGQIKGHLFQSFFCPVYTLYMQNICTNFTSCVCKGLKKSQHAANILPADVYWDCFSSVRATPSQVADIFYLAVSSLYKNVIVQKIWT